MHRTALRIRQRLYREGLVKALAAVDDVEVTGATASFKDVLRLATHGAIDVALIEVDANEREDRHLPAAIAQANPDVRVVVLHRGLDRFELHRLRRGGASATADVHHGLKTVVAAVTGKAPPENTIFLDEPARPSATPSVPALTPREHEVLELVASGITSRAISTQLAVSPKTVENHKQRIFNKLGVQSQGHAVALALRVGLLSPVPQTPVLDESPAATRSVGARG